MLKSDEFPLIHIVGYAQKGSTIKWQKSITLNFRSPNITVKAHTVNLPVMFATNFSLIVSFSCVQPTRRCKFVYFQNTLANDNVNNHYYNLFIKISIKELFCYESVLLFNSAL